MTYKETLLVKLKKVNDEYYLLDPDGEINDNVWALRPDGVVLKMTPNDMIDYLASESYATKKIIASTQKLDKLPLLDKAKMDAQILWNETQKSRDVSMSAIKSYETTKTPVGQNTAEVFIDGYKKGYTQSLTENKDKKFTLENIRRAILFGVSQGIEQSSLSVADEIKFIKALMSVVEKGVTEWEAEIEMGLYVHPDTVFIDDGKTYPVESITLPKTTNGYINTVKFVEKQTT